MIRFKESTCTVCSLCSISHWFHHRSGCCGAPAMTQSRDLESFRKPSTVGGKTLKTEHDWLTTIALRANQHYPHSCWLAERWRLNPFADDTIQHLRKWWETQVMLQSCASVWDSFLCVNVYINISYTVHKAGHCGLLTSELLHRSTSIYSCSGMVQADMRIVNITGF